MAIEAFSNFNIVLSDGGTVPSIDYLSSKTYVDIGSGNVLKVSWNAPIADNNVVDSYLVSIKVFDQTISDYILFYKANVGNVNDFFIRSSLFKDKLQSFFKLLVSVEAISKYGEAYSCVSNSEIVFVSRGCGTYIKVIEGYTQPIMKRAIAFAKLNYIALLDEAGKPILDTDGKVMYTKASSTHDDSTGWALMQEFYSLDPNSGAIYDSNGRAILDSNATAVGLDGTGWKKSDIRYEVLTLDGEIITDINDEPIYVL